MHWSESEPSPVQMEVEIINNEASNFESVRSGEDPLVTTVSTGAKSLQGTIIATQLDCDVGGTCATCPRKSFSSVRVYRPIRLGEEGHIIAKVSSDEDDETSSDSDVVVLQDDRHVYPDKGKPEDVVISDGRYFHDDVEDPEYQETEKSQWWCEACDRWFAHWLHYVSHHRRHQAPEMFTCPSCLTGFQDLDSCYDHERVMHDKHMQFVEGCGAITENLGVESRKICASTCVAPYNGPGVEDILTCFNIEKESGIVGRTVYTRIVDAGHVVRDG